MADKHKSKSLQERHPQAKPELYAPVPDKEAEAGTENTQIKDTCKGGMELESGSKHVAKVGIEREWFRPEVFYLTKDMFNLTTQRISPNPQTPYTSMDDARLKDMAGGMVFPCYPTAFVVARDISVKIVSDTTISSEFADSVKEHASAGGGFLFFSGSGSSSNSFSETCAHVSSTSNSVTVRFSTPQIIGYYMEATAPDQSTYLDDVSGSAQAGYVSIAEFVEKYRIMLEEMNHNKRSGRQFL